MRRKYRLTLPLLLLTAALLAFVGCQPAASGSSVSAPAVRYPDGVYRGFFNDRSIEQLSVEFTMKDQAFESIEFRAINYKDGDYLSEDATEIQRQVAAQYREATDYLTGRTVTALFDLLRPTALVRDMDAVTSATLNTGKLASALQDGLNRGVFKPTETTLFLPIPAYPDGIYRGFYNEGGIEQISVEFEYRDGRFISFAYRGLKDRTGDHLAQQLTPRQQQIADQYREATSYLVGKTPEALWALYHPAGIISDKDAVTGATLPANKLISAVQDGLNRGVYRPTATTVFSDPPSYPDGYYRGFYPESGAEQISLHFKVQNNRFVSIRFRALTYDGIDYLTVEGKPEQVSDQYREAADYLIGKELSAMWDLYDPSGLVSDKDAVTGATLRTGKFLSALQDGLNRGLYDIAQ